MPRWTEPLLLGLALITTTLVFDLLIEVRPVFPRLAWAAVDPFLHGALAGMLAWPLLARFPAERRAIGVATVGPAIFVDLDHFLAAGSLDLAAAVALPCRPPSHSLAGALVLAALVALVWRRPVLALGAGTGIASHVLRDAAGGCTPLFWPLALPREIPYPLYLASLVFLGWGMVACVWARQRGRSAGKPTRAETQG